MDINFAEAEAVVAYDAPAERAAAGGIYMTIARWTALVGTFFVPIFFLPWTTSILELNKEILLMVAAGTGLVAWLLGLVSSGRLNWRVGAFDGGLLAVLGAGIVATVFSLSRFTSMFGQPNNLGSALAAVACFTIFYFLIVQTSDDGGQTIGKALSVSLVIALLYGLLQLFGVYIIKFIPAFSFTASRAFNLVGSPDALGVLAAIALPLFLRKEKAPTFKWLNLVGFVAALVVLAVLNWWVLWTIAIAGMVGMISFSSLAEESKFSISKFTWPMTVIVLGVFLTVVGFNLTTVKNNLPVEVAPSFQLTGHVVKNALQQSFVTGYGPGNFSIAFDKFGAGKLTNSTLSTAKFYSGDSEAMNFAAEGGLLAMLAGLYLLWNLIQAVRKSVRRIHPENAPVWAALIAGAAAFFLYSFNFTLLFVAYVLLALVSLAITREHRSLNVEEKPWLSLSSSLGFIGGLILVLVGVYFGFSYYLGDVSYAKALNESDVQKAANDLVGAVNWNSHSDTYYRTASQAALGLLSQELNKKADPSDTQRTTRIQNYMSSAINLAKTATTQNPQEALNWENLGSVYQNLLGFVDGVDKLSEQSYLKAASLRPGDATYFNEIGSMYLAEASLNQQLAQQNPQQGQQFKQAATTALSSAEANFKQAVSMSNDYGVAIYNLGLVYDQEGKLTDAISQLEKVAPFNSDQPDLLFELGLLYYRNNQLDKALNTLQQVLVLSPNYANAHWYLSLIYQQRNDIPNAIDQLNKILAVDANKDNQTVLDRLHQLQGGTTAAPVKGLNTKPLQ